MAPGEIPFFQALPIGRELDYVAEAARTGRIGGGGAFGDRCAQFLQERLGVPRVLMTKSCSAALEIMGHLLGIEEGDEVILPSFAYVTTAGAFVARGARPVFADIQPDTLNIDPESVRACLTDRTRAIVALHYGGISCPMEELTAVASSAAVPLVEDNAHGLAARWRGTPLGSLGALSALSFHETKNVTCGEGGALAIADPQHLERAEILADKGTDRARFLRGEVESYSWVDLGSSYRLAELNAAWLWGQLEVLDDIQEVRARQWCRYHNELGEWARQHGVSLPVIPAECDSSHHTFFLLLPDEVTRDRFLEAMAATGVHASFHFLPLHLSKMGRALGGRQGDCPVSEQVSERLARLPLFHHMTEGQQARSIDAVRSFRA